MKANKDKGTSVGFSVDELHFRPIECEHEWEKIHESIIVEVCKKCNGNKFPINFKIAENLEQINKQQWEDIWNEWMNTDDYRTTTIFYHWLEKNYLAPEKK